MRIVNPIFSSNKNYFMVLVLVNYNNTSAIINVESSCAAFLKTVIYFLNIFFPGLLMTYIYLK